MKKYKAIAVPVTFIGDKPRFLTVRDRRFKDWIFVTGGCRRREIPNPIRCALSCLLYTSPSPRDPE